LFRQIARTVADRRDAMRDVERQQRLVLLDEIDAAAEVDMHVPQAGNQEAPPGVQRLRGLPGARDLSIGADRENGVARGDDRLVGDQARMFDVDDGGVTNQYVRRTACVGGRVGERRHDEDQRQQGLSEHGRSRARLGSTNGLYQ
jgi:hypothetical protein